MRQVYYPGSGDAWERRSPGSVGIGDEALREAVELAGTHETPWPRDLARLIGQVEKAPYNRVLGPMKARGEASGLVVRHGYIAAEWGHPQTLDMTFSAAKSYLATLAGLAWDAGRIRDLHEPVCSSVDDGGFDPPHNSKIIWHHLLQQTSEWEGTLFGIPDLVDRNRSLGPDLGVQKGTDRELRDPGTLWEYNDVRVNRLGLALLRIWGEPLPAVLKREVMRPIGASDSWTWYGYRNSWVDVNEQRMQSVPGGSHWGGGLCINSFDQARFGYLHLRRGEWEGKQILSPAWIERATAPCDHNSGYGYMWWLNADRQLYPAASAATFAAQGAGGNNVVIDPERDLVVVTRWCADVPAVIERIVAGITS